MLGIVVPVLLALALVLSLTPGGWASLHGLLVRTFGPAASATTPTVPGTPLDPNADRFLYEHTVPWGTLTVDGKPGPDVRTLGQLTTSSTPPPLPSFRLPRGQHRLVYQAALFPTLRCTVSVPAAFTDTCPRVPLLNYTDQPDLQSLRILDFRATLQHLPAAQCVTLVVAATGALDVLAVNELAAPSAQLEPGDHYLAADGRVAVATTGLTAIAAYTVDTSSIPNTSNDASSDTPSSTSPCFPLALAQSPLSPTTGYLFSNPTLGWGLWVPVHLSWQYAATADGHLVAHSAPATWTWPAPGTQVSELLGVQWRDGYWDATVPDDVVPCEIGERLLIQYLTGAAAADRDVFHEYPAPGPSCLLTFSATQDSQTELPTGAVGTALYRDGVFLALNHNAHAWMPDLPQADAHEQALAAPLEPAGTPP
jgi:hypothetical protein